ncbi:MAG: glycogen synthase [Actinomycetota bacterium]
MKVAFCSTEAVPFAKTGGMAEVAGILPAFLKKLNIDTCIIMPFYEKIFTGSNQKFAFKPIKSGLNQPMNDSEEEFFDIYGSKHNNVSYYFIKHDIFFGSRKNIYGTRRRDYKDNGKRFCFFSKAILTCMEELGFKPDIIHLNDYHCAMVPVFLNHYRQLGYPERDFFSKTSTVLSVHNLAYQGIYEKDLIYYCGLGDKYFNIDALEWYGKVNFLKGGILFSDEIATVSPTYAQEIMTPYYGYGLDGVLRKRKKDIVGILNGIDYAFWNPETDKDIKSNYSLKDLRAKEDCKKDLVRKLFKHADTQKPVLYMVARLSEQKGIDLLVSILDSLMEEDVFLAVLGAGDEKYVNLLKGLRKKYKDNFSINTSFSHKLERRIISGSDICLMPSRYEPCGLGQLKSLRYGSVPVVRNTGGLADSVKDIQSKEDIQKGGTGFKFESYNPDEFLNAIKKALSFYSNKKLWIKIQQNAMKCDFSWERSCREYRHLYLSLRKQKRQ